MEQTMRTNYSLGVAPRTIHDHIRERVAGCQTARAMADRIAEPVTYPAMDRPIYSGPAGEWDMMLDELERLDALDNIADDFGVCD